MYSTVQYSTVHVRCPGLWQRNLALITTCSRLNSPNAKCEAPNGSILCKVSPSSIVLLQSQESGVSGNRTRRKAWDRIPQYIVKLQIARTDSPAPEPESMKRQMRETTVESSLLRWLCQPTDQPIMRRADNPSCMRKAREGRRDWRPTAAVPQKRGRGG